MPKKILVVDDDPVIIKTIHAVLAKKYSLITASNGTEGLKKAAEEKPDLILLDVIMPPGLNGFEVCKVLKEDELTKSIPVIMLTSLDGERDLCKGLGEGARCFISKPFNAVDLMLEIKTALREGKKKK